MRKIVFDFKIIDGEEKFYDFLEKELNLNDLIAGEWGRNLPAFWDLYGYGDDEDLFELRNYNELPEGDYKELIKHFISFLQDLKGCQEVDGWVVPNPSFNYKIID